MTYRDDRDADQARIAALESELSAAKQRIDELEGKRSQALVLASSRELAPGGKAHAAQRWLGAPLRLELARRFDGAYPTDKFEELIDRIRDVTRDRGRTELLRTSVAWWASSPERSAGPFTCVTVSVKDNVTSLSVTDRLGALAGVWFGGLGGGVGGGGIMAPIGATIAMPVLAPVWFAAWFGGFYALSRRLFKRSAKKRAEALQQLYDIVEREIEQALQR